MTTQTHDEQHSNIFTEDKLLLLLPAVVPGSVGTVSPEGSLRPATWDSLGFVTVPELQSSSHAFCWVQCGRISWKVDPGCGFLLLPRAPVWLHEVLNWLIVCQLGKAPAKKQGGGSRTEGTAHGLPRLTTVCSANVPVAARGCL